MSDNYSDFVILRPAIRARSGIQRSFKLPILQKVVTWVPVYLNESNTTVYVNESTNGTCFSFTSSPDSTESAVFAFTAACSPIIICLNVLVLYIALKYINFKQHLDQLLVVNMTAADFLFGLIYLTSIHHHVDVPRSLCKSFRVFSWTFNVASINFLLLLNVYKVIILYFPVYSYARMSILKIMVPIVLCWFIVIVSSVGFSFEPALMQLPNTCESCILQFDHKMDAAMIMCFYIVPLTLSLVLSALIFGMAQSRAVRQKHRNRDEVENVAEERKKMFTRIVFVFTSTIWAGVTYLPFRIMEFEIALCRYNHGTLASSFVTNITSFEKLEAGIKARDANCFSPTIKNTNFALMALFVFGFVITPLITIYTQQIYRQRVVEVFRWIKSCGASARKRGESRETERSSYQAATKSSII